MNFVEIAARSRAHLDGFRRFKATDVFIPFNDFTRDRFDDRNRRRGWQRWGSVLSASRAGSDRECGKKWEGASLHKSVLRLQVGLDKPEQLVHIARNLGEQI